MPPKTTILYLITEFDIGGAENMLYELASRLDKSRFKVHACCLTGRGPVGAKLSASGAEVFHLDMRGKWDFTAFFRLILLLRRERIKILHTFLFHANFMGRIAGRIAGVPVIISSVRVSERRQRMHLLGERLTWRLADLILCVSNAVKEFMSELGIPASRMRVIPNGVDIPVPDAGFDPAPLKNELGIPVNSKVVGTLSRLTEQKRLDRLIECAARINKRAPGTYFLVVGRGELRDELEAYASEKGAAEKIKFLGFRQDAAALLSIFDVFMLTSSWEGMPVSLLEAMALGKPPVVSAVEGSSEVVLDGKSGYLVEPDDIETYCERVTGLLQNPALAEEIGRNAKARASEFSVGNMVKRNEAVYSEFIQKNLLFKIQKCSV